MKREIVEIIFGSYTLVQIIGMGWFIFIGLLINSMNDIINRDINSSRSPIDWSWKFWIKDNIFRYILSVLTIYIMVRFYPEISGNEISFFEAFMLGYLGDGVGVMLKKRTLKKMNNILK